MGGRARASGEEEGFGDAGFTKALEVGVQDLEGGQRWGDGVVVLQWDCVVGLAVS